VKQARFANQSARPRRVLARDRLAPAARRRVRARPPRGVQRAKPWRRASSAAPRCNPRFCFRSLRCLVAQGQAARSPLLAWSLPWPEARLRARSRHPAPEDGARGSSSRAGRGQASGQVPRSARPQQSGSGQYLPGSSPRQGASSAPGNWGKLGARSLPSGHVQPEGSLQKFCPWPISALSYPLLRLLAQGQASRSSSLARGGGGVMRERHGLAAASSAQPGLGPPPHSGSCGTVVEARWLRVGRGARGDPCQPRPSHRRRPSSA